MFRLLFLFACIYAFPPNPAARDLAIPVNEGQNCDMISFTYAQGKYYGYIGGYDVGAPVLYNPGARSEDQMKAYCGSLGLCPYHRTENKDGASAFPPLLVCCMDGNAEIDQRYSEDAKIFPIDQAGYPCGFTEELGIKFYYKITNQSLICENGMTVEKYRPQLLIESSICTSKCNDGLSCKENINAAMIKTCGDMPDRISAVKFIEADTFCGFMGTHFNAPMNRTEIDYYYCANGKYCNKKKECVSREIVFSTEICGIVLDTFNVCKENYRCKDKKCHKLTLSGKQGETCSDTDDTYAHCEEGLVCDGYCHEPIEMGKFKVAGMVLTGLFVLGSGVLLYAYYIEYDVKSYFIK